MSDKNKIVRFRKPFKLNIGIVVFIFLLCYLVFQIINFILAGHVSVYEVEEGALAANTTYTGLALYEEKIVYSEQDGYINYYPKAGSKVSYGDQVYSVDTSGVYYNQIAEAVQNASSLTQETYDALADSVDEFLNSYRDMDFSAVYRYKDEINSNLDEALSEEALETVYNEAGSGFTVYTAKEPGIIAYDTDGFENVTVENFTADMFSESAYSKNNLKEQEVTTAGGPVYKLVTGEYWNLVVPADEMLIHSLEESGNIKIRFLKDEASAWAEYSFTEKKNIPYLVLTLKNSSVRYFPERYLEIEVILEQNTGLKIPNSAIIQKDFFVIPEEYFLSGDDTGSLGLLLKQEGTDDAAFVSTTVYYKENGSYYIDEEEIVSGSVILKPDSTETYVVKDSAALDGVYNINKGYAVFKQIEVTASNEEYSIVKEGTDFGLNLYDHIALDGTSINEGEMVQ